MIVEEYEYKFAEEIDGPELMCIPPKVQKLFHLFNQYKIIIIEGGRGSAKSHSIARILLYIMQERTVRLVCGREIQATIEESVYALFCDLISKYALAYRVLKNRIRHLVSGSVSSFKGFRERGAVNVKGIEGADIVWVDEAQALTKPTIDVLLPTLRKQDSPVKFIFTLNRLLREDAVMELADRDDCLVIHIDYFENPYCPVTLLDEAEICKNRSERDYNHIWLGQPVKAGDEMIFDTDDLYHSMRQKPYGDLFFKARVIGIDWAAQGNDLCVATILDRGSAEHWTLTQQIKWDEPDTEISVGKIITMIGDFKPNVVVIDIGGGGYNVYCKLINTKLGGVTIVPFDGGSRKGIGPRSLNQRADGYWNLRDWFENKWLCIGEGFKDDVLKQLERLKQKFRPDGLRQVREKQEYKAEHGHSPDEADSLMMAVYGCRHLGKETNSNKDQGQTITRKTGSKRRI